MLRRYVDAIVLRTFEQERLELLASASSVPVVNSLSDFEHPCQALADLLTIRERLGGPEGRVAHLPRRREQRGALAAAGRREGRHARCGWRRRRGSSRSRRWCTGPTEIAAETGGSVEITDDPPTAATGADVLYTDVWASMGQEAEADERALVFRGYQLDQKLVDLALPTSSCCTACPRTGARRSPPR